MMFSDLIFSSLLQRMKGEQRSRQRRRSVKPEKKDRLPRPRNFRRPLLLLQDVWLFLFSVHGYYDSYGNDYQVLSYFVCRERAYHQMDS